MSTISLEKVDDIGFRLLPYLLILAICAVVLIPFLFVLSVSIRPPTGLYGPPHLIPESITLKFWKDAIQTVGPHLKNSAIIATGTAVVSLIITIPGAYVFARTEFPGKKPAFYSILVALLFPYILLVLPISDLWYELGLYNTRIGLILAYQAFVTPFALWILRDFFENLPHNLEEAAQVYGCTQFGAFYRVIVPLAMPAIVATGFLAFLTGWNDFLFANMLTTGTGPRTAVVTLFLSTTGGEITSWGHTMAATLLVGIPPTVLYMVARRYLTESFALS